MTSSSSQKTNLLNFVEQLPKKEKVNEDIDVNQFFSFASELVDFEWKHHRKDQSISQKKYKISSLENLRQSRRIVPSDASHQDLAKTSETSRKSSRS